MLHIAIPLASHHLACGRRQQGPALSIPFAFLELRPEATKAFLKRSQYWLAAHTRQLIACTVLTLGAYLAVSTLVRLG